MPFAKHPKQALPEITVGLIMAVLVIPQSLGYAMLAGLPPVMGLYTAITPVMVYAYIGSSSVNAIGPVAITAVMTAGALSAYSVGSQQYVQMAMSLAFLVGVILLIAHLLRLGWIMQFISRGVSAGFISGAAVLTIISQLKHLIGLPIMGDTLITMLKNLHGTHITIKPATALLGSLLLALFLVNQYRSRWFWGWLPDRLALFAKQFFAVACVVTLISLHHIIDWSSHDITVLSALPKGLSTPHLPILSIKVLSELLPSALLIALIAFVSSATISGNFARVRKEPFDNARELKGLGLANLTSSLFGGFPVTGGLSRTSLNVMVGANSPLASVICAIGVLVIMLFFGDYLAGLPYTLLSAIIMSSMIAMIDVATFKKTLRSDRSETISFATSFIVCVFFGLNFGLVAGLLTSFAMMIYRSHHVHIAVVGQVGTGHYRNVLRHEATTFDEILMLRIDENLYFGNSSIVKDRLTALIQKSPAHDILISLIGVNHLDLSAQEMLISLNSEIKTQNKRLHLCEIKGPVMDMLISTPVIDELSGHTFLSFGEGVEFLLGSPTKQEQAHHPTA